MKFLTRFIFKWLGFAAIISVCAAVFSCAGSPASDSPRPRYLSPGVFMADPAAHVFNGRLYIYPSHDRRSGGYGSGSQDGGAYDMVDYHVFSLDDVFNGEVTDHGVVLALADIPWARGQLWDNDVAHKDGKYYMYFPARDKSNIFRIGVAVAEKPEGPFISQPEPIKGSYSIDPCVFEEDGNYYMYFGGIWGGQLQFYDGNTYKASGRESTGEAASPRIAKLSDDMLQFAESPREVKILGNNGRPLSDISADKRFFEASWMHKYNGVYYFSYSTGDTHYLCYATGDNPYGPFTYQGIILTPVSGWTTHHSIVEYKGKWYLFYHDSRPSGGVDHLRSMKVTELIHLPDGSIQRINGAR
ncbi:MAG: glycoside hydrolase family 43 protein [Treponema sp.]|nr:glycoside hydrolase family 43 protein [Treponema sp.]